MALEPPAPRQRRSFETLAALVALVLAAAISGVVLLGEPRPLAVVAVRPVDGAAGVPIATQVTVTFSRPVDEPSIRAALSVHPETQGLVSAAGRRAAFTPRGGFRADTEYTLTLGTGLRDRAGQSLRQPVAIRFRTRGQRLVVRTVDGRLLRATLEGATESLAGPGVGEFAVSAAGDVAYVQPAEAVLVVQPGGPGAARRIPLPRKVAKFQPQGTAVEVRQLAWAPDGATIGFLGATGDGANALYLVRLDEARPTPTPFGSPPDLAPRAASPIPEALKRTLADIVFGRDTFAFTPDGRGVIVRERNWEYAVLGFDGLERGTFGPFLAVGNASPRGQMVAFVDLDPSEPEPRRQVAAYERAGRLRPLSSADRDSHSPRFAHRRAVVAFVAAVEAGPPPARGYAIEVADVETGVQRRLTAPPVGESDEEPRWSLDDEWISFRRVIVEPSSRGAGRGGEVWLVPAEGGPARRLSISATDVAWSP